MINQRSNLRITIDKIKLPHFPFYLQQIPLSRIYYTHKLDPILRNVNLIYDHF